MSNPNSGPCSQKDAFATLLSVISKQEVIGARGKTPFANIGLQKDDAHVSDSNHQARNLKSSPHEIIRFPNSLLQTWFHPKGVWTDLSCYSQGHTLRRTSLRPSSHIGHATPRHVTQQEDTKSTGDKLSIYRIEMLYFLLRQFILVLVVLQYTILLLQSFKRFCYVAWRVVAHVWTVPEACRMITRDSTVLCPIPVLCRGGVCLMCGLGVYLFMFIWPLGNCFQQVLYLL